MRPGIDKLSLGLNAAEQPHSLFTKAVSSSFQVGKGNSKKLLILFG